MAKKKKIMNLAKLSQNQTNYQPVGKVDNRTAEEKDRDFGIANVIRWHRLTTILVFVGLLVGLLGKVREWEYVQYLGIVFWMAAIVCYYNFVQRRNEMIMRRELKRKEQRKAEKKKNEKKE